MKKLYLLFFLSGLTTNSWCQQTTTVPNFSLRVVPQFLLVNGLRVDAEWQLDETWALYVAPTYYYGTSNKNGQYTRTITSFGSHPEASNDQINGYALYAGVKYCFLQPGRFREYGYIGADFGAKNIDYAFKDFDFFPQVQNGITYYSYRLGDMKGNSYQTGVNVFMGYSLQVERTVGEMYLGLGYRECVQTELLKKYRSYEASTLNYAYSGFLLYGGFKVGYFIN